MNPTTESQPTPKPAPSQIDIIRDLQEKADRYAKLAADLDEQNKTLDASANLLAARMAEAESKAESGSFGRRVKGAIGGLLAFICGWLLLALLIALAGIATHAAVMLFDQGWQLIP